MRGAPGGDRTHDQPLRRRLLYPLSYRGVRELWHVGKSLIGCWGRLAAVRTALVLTVAMLAAFGSAQKKVLDHTVYDGWKAARSGTFSADGRWFAYVIAPQEGDAVLHIRATSSDKTYTLDRISTFRFSGDSKFFVGTQVPKFADAKKARVDKVKPEDAPKNGLVILNLDSGEKFERERVTSFTMAEEDKGWVLYRPEPPKTEPARPAAGAGAGAGAAAPQAGAAPGQPEPKDDKPKKKTDHRPGEGYVLRDLATGKETTLNDVTASVFSKNGATLVLALSTKDGAGDGIVWRDLASGKTTPIVTQLGRYTKLTLSEDGTKLAYQTDKDDYAAKKPSPAVYLYEAGSQAAKLIAKEGTPGMPEGFVVADGGALRFSRSGTRLFFATGPKPVEEKPNPVPEEDRVSLDLWSWTDPLMMPQQLLQANAVRNRTYDVVALLATGRLVALESKTRPSVTVPNRLDGRFGLATNNLNYQREISWGLEYVDAELVDLETGTSQPLFTKFEGNLGMSPTGRYVWGYDAPRKDLFAIDVMSMQRVSLNKDLPHPIWNEEFDNPDYPPLYGFGGWTENDEAVLIYDEFDIWKVDAKGIKRPDRITSGRTSRHSYRITRTDLDQDFIGTEFLATVVNQNTMASGFHRVSLDGRNDRRLVWGDKRFTFAAKAKNADRWAITRQDFVECPDYWLTNSDMANPVKVSDANPQQKDYNWGTAELVSYRSNDGVELKGILIKPEDFDYSKKYPLIAYFYERDSDTLHQYRSPAPSASTVNLPMYASNGYLIFIPDIPYKEGYPGESAVSAITAGVNSIVARGYVDPKRLGIQGQSWGGYQVTYLVTETNMFAAACAGAPVSNMVSAYGGIRWGSGLVRQMQYERGQSRIAGSVWDKPLRYIENSPIFFADKVQTPLLMMANDKDGAVPWYQGIEFFAALRRLEKPVWMAVYNNEDHNLMERKNRKDWSVRMQQFFDHYLKGAPMPKWMKEGIPAVDKGKDYGFELTKPGG